MGLLLVVNVLSLGLQATGARRVSAAPERPAEIEREVMSTSYASALAARRCVALLAEPGHHRRCCNLDSLGRGGPGRGDARCRCRSWAARPASCRASDAGARWPASTSPSGWAGIGFGAVALRRRAEHARARWSASPSARSSRSSSAGCALRRPDRRRARPAPRPAATRPRWAPGGVLRETMHNSHALLAFFALSNADVIIARSTLDEHQAGLYAGGLILSKAVLFLPQFVVVVAFPSMRERGAPTGACTCSASRVVLRDRRGRHRGGRRRAVAGSRWSFVGGSQYAELEGRLWAFAVLGTLLAMLQLLIYNIVARQRQRTVLRGLGRAPGGRCWRRPVRRTRSTALLDRAWSCVDALLFLAAAGPQPDPVVLRAGPAGRRPRRLTR